VSKNGGQYPRWNSKGDELFYVTGNTMMAAKVETQDKVRVVKTQALFTGEDVGATLYDGRLNFIPTYDVSSDGQRFVIIQRVEGEEIPTITLVMNWIKEFEGRK
jgi:hypothetical protein